MNKEPGIEIILQVGTEGGDLTLVGRPRDGGGWQFARITDDQTEALFGESDVTVSRPPALESLEWVDDWEAGVTLLDRYSWVQLYPLAVHAEFAELVRAAIEVRLQRITNDASRERARANWIRFFARTAMGVRT